MSGDNFNHVENYDKRANEWFNEMILGIQENDINIKRAEDLIQNYQLQILNLRDQNELKYKTCREFLKECLSDSSTKIEEKYIKFLEENICPEKDQK